MKLWLHLSQPKQKMVYLLLGNPCAGKSFYADQHRTPRDIVIDVDRLIDALGGDGHNPRLEQMTIVTDVIIPALYDAVKARRGRWENCYIISTAASRKQIEDLKERVNADEIIILDTPKEVCLERAKNERPDYFQSLIENWSTVHERDYGK